jgi:16S rRNA (cytosine1402-N4)-methyltransferase
MPDDAVHAPVLVREVLALLDPQPGQRAIDATVDGGGHAAAILERLGPKGCLLGIDRDAELLAMARERLAWAHADERLILVHDSFRLIGAIAAAQGFTGVSAILFDLGLSSYHLDRSGRGFSFRGDEPLDLRFDPTDDTLETAADILATRPAGELTALFRDWGEERFASRIARSIVAVRQRHPLRTTAQLLEVITRTLPGRERQRAGRSAARVFQALRIAVNAELDAVQAALPQALELLVPGGRLAVIAFHSLEDRLVKTFFTEMRRAERVRVLTKRPLRPSDAEITANPRAASAKLRVAEKL